MTTPQGPRGHSGRAGVPELCPTPPLSQPPRSASRLQFAGHRGAGTRCSAARRPRAHPSSSPAARAGHPNGVPRCTWWGCSQQPARPAARTRARHGVAYPLYPPASTLQAPICLPVRGGRWFRSPTTRRHPLLYPPLRSPASSLMLVTLGLAHLWKVSMKRTVPDLQRMTMELVDAPPE